MTGEMKMTEQLYRIASIKHTNREHEHITWWGLNHCGYTPVLGERCGTYTLDEAKALNDGFDCLAVPVSAVDALLSPEPYFRPHNPARFYDQRGPVVENSRKNWNRLIKAGLAGRIHNPRPEVFRGKHRAFSLPYSMEQAQCNAAGEMKEGELQ
jgi:hypothetical protein